MQSTFLPSLKTLVTSIHQLIHACTHAHTFYKCSSSACTVPWRSARRPTRCVLYKEIHAGLVFMLCVCICTGLKCSNSTATFAHSKQANRINTKHKHLGWRLHQEIFARAGQDAHQVHLRALEGTKNIWIRIGLSVCAHVQPDGPKHPLASSCRPTTFHHRPNTTIQQLNHQAPKAVQEQAGCIIGRDYPFPIVDHAEVSKVPK